LGLVQVGLGEHWGVLRRDCGEGGHVRERVVRERVCEVEKAVQLRLQVG